MKGLIRKREMENIVGNVLIISNAAMCQGDSNGRTMSRMLDCIPRGQKAQFYVYGNPDFKEGAFFYHVSDGDALVSFIKRVKKDGTVENNQKKADTAPVVRRYKKTPLKMLLRELAWRFGTWNNRYLKNWVDSINPVVIFVVAGDNAFTLNFSRKIAKQRRIPIILYSTEEYQFKKYNYVTKRFSLFYKFWSIMINSSYKKIEKYVKYGVFNTESLALKYGQEYNYPCCAIYPTSDIEWIENYRIKNPKTVSYIGNLGLNRHKSLIQMAELIGKIAPDMRMDVYGNASDSIKSEFEKCPFISYKGFIPYKDVVSVIHNSMLLVHAEYPDEFYTRDLKYAFSTKLADSVCSGTPFLIYAPSELEETIFLKENDCAFVSSDLVELEQQFKLALLDENARKEKVEKAYLIRKKIFTDNGQMKKIFKAVLGESTSG